jgi:hypothetical protein
LLNIIAGTFSVGVPPIPPSSYESIATVTVGSGGQADVEFTSIPSGFEHLQIRVLSRDTRSANSNNFNTRMNGDTASNYSIHILYGNGSSALAYGEASSTFTEGGTETSASATASIFGVAIIDILDYDNTNKYKTLRSLSGNDRNGAGDMRFYSGVWLNTNAITSLKFTPETSGNFAEYSSFALYGIKGV